MIDHREIIVAPHSADAEQALLGSLMVDHGQIDRIGELPESAFFRRDHQRIYSAIRAQIANGKPADAVSLFESFGGRADDVGGLAYLGELQSGCASPRSAQRYAEIVREYAIRRDLLCVGDQISGLAMDRSLSAAEALDKSQALAMGVAEQVAFGRSEPKHVRGVLCSYVDDLIGRYDNPKIARGISTGFPDIDKRIPGGMDQGWMVVVAGRPGMGKTTFAIQIAAEYAKAGHGALILSQEMPDLQLGERLLSIYARVPLEALRSAHLHDDQLERIAAASAALSESPIWIDEQPALSLEQVRTKCRQVKRQEGLRLVVIDYLQLMVGSGENRTREISTITAGIKSLAKELRATVIALSQLNRQVENRPNKRPIMADLRESGSIEQDADLVIGLYRDEVYEDDSPYTGLAEALFLKHRSGKAGGFVPLTFNGECTRFDSMFGEWPKEKPAKTSRKFGFD